MRNFPNEYFCWIETSLHLSSIFIIRYDNALTLCSGSISLNYITLKKTSVYTKKYLSIKCHLPKNYTLCLEVTCVNLVYFYRAQTLFQNRYIMVNYVSLKIKQIIVCHFIFTYFLFSIFQISSYTSKKCLHLYSRSHSNFI